MRRREWSDGRKEHEYRSMREFKERFSPKQIEDRILETETDPAKLGIALTKESLRKIGS